MKKRIMSFLLTLAMVVGLMPGMSLTAYAQTWDGNPYASLVNTTTQVTFNGKPWYIIADDSTAVDAGTVTLLAADTSFGVSAFHDGLDNTYANSTVKSALDVLTASGSFKDVASAIEDTDVGKLYLLSTDEAKKLDGDILKLQFTGSQIPGSGWWLRSPVFNYFGAAFVNGVDGIVDEHGDTLADEFDINTKAGVRPALKLNLSSVIFSSETKEFTMGGSTIAVTSVSLNPSATQTIDVDGKVSFTATVAPDNATDKKVKWSVGGTNSGAVKLYTDEACTTEVGTEATSTLTVYAKGISAGSATVTAASNADSTKSASCEVTVKSSSMLTLNVGDNGTVVMNSGIYGNGSETLLEVTIKITNKGNLNCQDGYSINVAENASIDIQTGGVVSFYPASDNTGAITAVPADGYAFAGWYNGETLYSDNAELEYKKISEDLDLTAKFEAVMYSVTITPGSNMTKTETSGAASQTSLTGPMTDVVYTADEGYYFPENYSVDAVNGISVTRNSYTQIAVSGTPTADAAITLTASTAKTTPDAPTTAAAENCTTTDNNDGKLTGVTTAMEYKKSDAENWTAVEGNEITGLAPGKYYVRVKATDTTLPSDNQELTIKGLISATVKFKVVNGSWDEGEGEAATKEKTVTLTGYEGDTLKLTADQIPAVGAKPNDTYKAGSWDTEPNTSKEITTDTTYTYTYAAKGAQTIAVEDVTATYGDTDKSVSATVTDPATGAGAISYAVKEGSEDYIDVDASNGSLTIKKVPADGKAYVIATAAETDDYLETTKEVTVTISKKEVTVSGIKAEEKEYDGTTDATADTNSATVNGLVSGDKVTVSANASFYDKNVGEDKTVALSNLALTGDDAANYVLASSGQQEEATASITPKEVTVSGITANDKIYNGNTDAELTTTEATFDGKLDSDTLSVSGTGTFDNANVGNGKTVTISSLTLGGDSKDNYVLADEGQQTSTTASITAKEVGLEWSNTELTYNGEAQKPTATATGLVGSDTCTVTVTGEQTNAGDNYTATAESLSNSNYTLPSEKKTSFTISPKSINGASVTLDKTELTYNGSEQSVTVATVSLDGGSLTADDYTVSGNTGTNKNDYTVTVTGKGNYTDSATADWKIVAKAMTVSAEPVSKTYDGNEYGITVTVTDPSEGTTIKYGTEKGTYDKDESPKYKNVGTYNVYFKVSGNNNYNDYEGSATVTISKKPVTASVSAEDKTYDGKTDATVSASVKPEDLASGDSIEITGLTGNFTDANAGDSKKVTVDSSAKQISGTGSDNYEVTIPEETTASITHLITEVKEVPATCTETGKKQHWKDEEGTLYKDAEGKETATEAELVIPALEHDWNNPTYEWAEDNSTVTATRTCKNDASHIETETAKTTSKVTKDATETEEGETTYTATFKNPAFTEQTKTESIPKLEPEEEVTYSNTKGNGTQWTKGSTSTADFTFKRSKNDSETFSHFTGIQVDGKDVAASDYTAESGSVIVKLKPSYLETLSVGEHTLTALFDDGNKASAKFTVVAKKASGNSNTTNSTTKKANTVSSTGAPKTGDTSNMPLWFTILCASILVLFNVIIIRRRNAMGHRR